MRYYFFAYSFAAISVFTVSFYATDDRSPASAYPNFANVAALTPVAPTPRDLAAPTNSPNPFSMKNIEDTYKGFLANETELAEQATASRTRLQHYLSLRNNNPNVNYFVNSSSQLLHAITTEQNNLVRIEGQRQFNSFYALQKINLLNLSIQVGLRAESKARIVELTDYLLHVNFQASSNAFPTTFASITPSWTDQALLEFTPQFTRTVETIHTPTSNGFIDDDFIGPRLPDQQQQMTTGNTPGTVAI